MATYTLDEVVNGAKKKTYSIDEVMAAPKDLAKSQIIEVPNYGEVEFPSDMSDEEIVSAIKKNALGYKRPQAQKDANTAQLSKRANYQTQLEDAIIAAHESGDTEGAQVLANELKTWKPKANLDKLTTIKKSTKKWSDLPMEALSNTPSSAWNFASGIGHAITNPLDTVTNLGKLALGAAENAGGGIVNKAVGMFNPDLVAFNEKTRQPSKPEQMADAAGSFYKERYGSSEGFKNTIATDPVGLLADASTILTAGGGLAAKLPALSKVGGAVSSSANIIDPISMAANLTSKGARSLGGGVANVIGGIGTHTGGASLKQAFRAGKDGGSTAKSFTDNMRGNVPITDVLSEARAGLQTMGMEKSAAYRSGMAKVSNDKSVLSFSGIDKALDNTFNIASFKGKVTNTKAFEVQQAIAEEIKNWKALNPDEFHTPEGLDALKQKIGGIQEAIPFEQKTARTVAGKVYNSIKAEIAKQAPTYSETMKGYADASDQINEIERALSLGGKASVDTSIRKLQSIMRNNVNTNYGNRLGLAQKIEEQGKVNIIPALAGQSLNSWTPRGLGGAVAGATGGAGLVTMNPMVIPALAMQSPRLMGETALKAGQVTGLLDDGLSVTNKSLKSLRVNPKVLANVLYQIDKQNED